MASNGLGAIAISLGLDAAEFTQGMTKAEYDAKKLGEMLGVGLGKAINTVVLSFGTMAAAGTTALAVLNNQANSIAAYQDLADQIGDAADQVASLKLAADLSGTAMDTVAQASIKLTDSLAKSDDEAKGAGAAIAALGLDMAKFRELSPVEQIEAVARALNEFEDGAGKTAVAVGLFGRSGAQLVPFLKDLADGGERNIALTAEQIQQADEYTKAQARLKSEFESFVQLQTTKTLPILKDIQQVMADLAKDEATVTAVTETLEASIKAAVVVFQTLAVVGSDVGFVFLSVGREIGAWAAQIAALATGDLQGFRAISDAVKADGKRAREELDRFQERIMSIGQKRLDLGWMVDSGEKPKAKALNFSTATEKKPVVSEAEKYLENLQKQLQTAKDLSVAENVLADIQSGRLKLSNGITQEQLIAIAKQIDQQKALKVELDRVAKANEDINKTAEAYAEVVAANNAITNFELSLLGITNEERKVALEQFKIQIDLEKKIRDIRKQRGSDADTEKAIASVTDSAGAASANVSAKAFLEEQQKVADEATKVWDNFTQNVQRNLGDQLYGAMRGNFDNIGDAFLSMIQRMLADAMAANLTKALMGGSDGSGGLLGGLFNVGMSLFGGGAGAATNAAANAGAVSNLSGSLGSGFYGIDLPSFDVGTPYVQEDMVAKIHKGERILTAAENRNFKGGGNTMPPVTFSPVYQIDSRTDRAAIMQDMQRISQKANADLVDKLTRARAI